MVYLKQVRFLQHYSLFMTGSIMDV